MKFIKIDYRNKGLLYKNIFLFKLRLIWMVKLMRFICCVIYIVGYRLNKIDSLNLLFNNMNICVRINIFIETYINVKLRKCIYNREEN